MYTILSDAVLFQVHKYKRDLYVIYYYYFPYIFRHCNKIACDNCLAVCLLYNAIIKLCNAIIKFEYMSYSFQ